MIPIDLEVGDYIDLLYQKRAERLEAQAAVEAMEAEEKAIKEMIIQLLDTQGLKMGGGKIATASITRRIVGNPTDWDKLYAYILENKAFDLLHKRISDTAYRDRLEQGEAVPGLEPFPVIGLSLVKASRK